MTEPLHHLLPAVGLATSTRFDDHVWLRYRAIVVIGAVSRAIVFPYQDCLIVPAPSRRDALQALRARDREQLRQARGLLSRAAAPGGVK